MSNKFLIGGVVVIMAIAGILYTVRQGPKDNSPIKIGWIGPLTGDAAAAGEPVKNATALAVEEVNFKGGINGRQIQMIYEDGKCNGKDALIAFRKLIDVDKVKIVLGGFCSGETLGAAPAVNSSKLILFSAGSSAPDITNAGDYVFRNFPSDASSGKKIAELAINKNIKRVGLLTESTDYAQSLRKVFVDRFAELGGAITADEKISSRTKDFRSNITKIKENDPDAIYIVMQTPENEERGLSQLREQGWNKQILGNELIHSDPVLKNAPKTVEGAFYAEAAFDENNPAAKSLFENYKARYGNAGGGVPPIYLATFYDAVNILAEQIEKYGENPDKIKEGLYQIKDREGAAGKLTIDKNGDAVMEYVVKTVRNGKPELVRE